MIIGVDRKVYMMSYEAMYEYFVPQIHRCKQLLKRRRGGHNTAAKKVIGQIFGTQMKRIDGGMIASPIRLAFLTVQKA